MLREVMARGVDRAILVSAREFGGSDTYATLTQTMIFILICLLSYFTPRRPEMTIRWTSEVPS